MTLLFSGAAQQNAAQTSHSSVDLATTYSPAS